MSSRLFWRTTPRKFSALCQVHVDLNSTDKNKKSRNDKQNTIGQPNVYVDQLGFM